MFEVTGTFFGCDHCEEMFEHKAQCEKHEATCPYNPASEHCYTCHNRTREGYYNPHCKLTHHKLPVAHCPQWQQASK